AHGRGARGGAAAVLRRCHPRPAAVVPVAHGAPAALRGGTPPGPDALPRSGGRRAPRTARRVRTASRATTAPPAPAALTGAWHGTHGQPAKVGFRGSGQWGRVQGDLPDAFPTALRRHGDRAAPSRYRGAREVVGGIAGRGGSARPYDRTKTLTMSPRRYLAV